MSIFSKIADIFRKKDQPATTDTVQTGSGNNTAAGQAFKPNPQTQNQSQFGSNQGQQNPQFGPNTQQPQQDQEAYAPPKRFRKMSLSERSRQNDAANGIDWSGASENEIAYRDMYYACLDDDAHTRMYRDLERYDQGNQWGEDRKAEFTAKYQAGMDQLEAELKEIKAQYGKHSNEYKAMEQFMSDYEWVARSVMSRTTQQEASKVSSQMDQTIDSLFGGVMESPDFMTYVEQGKAMLEKNGTLSKRFHLDTASEKQRNLIYYAYATGGKDEAKMLFDRFLGDTINYQAAAADFSSDLENDSKLGRFWETLKANTASALKGQAGSGFRQVFTNMSADPNDRTILGDYSINDSLDHYLRGQLDGVSDEDLSTYGSEGFQQLWSSGAGWVQDAAQNASDYQKQFLGYLYLATESMEDAEEAWQSLKQRGDAIWQTVNGKESIATAMSSQEGQMYRQYLGLNSAEMPDWITPGEEDDVLTIAQAVWDLAETTQAQLPQIAASLAVGSINPAAGLVFGNAVMGTQVYGNSYKQSIDEGHTPEEARLYAASQAVSELGVGILLDGIAPVAGLLTGNMGAKIVRNISNPFVKALTTMGIRAAGEGIEEYIQEVADPVLRNLIYHESNAVELMSSDALYSFALGALSALAMGPGNTARDFHTNIKTKAVGDALIYQGSMNKLLNTVLNNPVEGADKAQTKLYGEAKELAQKIVDGKAQINGLNVGEVMQKYRQAGGELGWLTDPATVTYTKDSITDEDMLAGATSMLSTLGESTELAADIVKLARGETITTEAQEAISKSEAAKKVLSDLQGDLDMDTDNALSRAAKVTVVKDKLKKVYTARKTMNPEKTVVTPATQSLLQSGVKLEEAEKIGAVFDKVLDGQTITPAEAKLVRVSSPAIRAVALDTLGIELSEFSSADIVLNQLNELAQLQQKVKEQQADLKRNAAAAAKARGQQMQGGLQNGQSGLQQNDQGGSAGLGGAEVSGAASQNVPGAEGQAAGGVTPDGKAPGDLAGARRRTRARGKSAPVYQDSKKQRVVPPTEWTDEEKSLQQRGVTRGATTVQFRENLPSVTRYIPGEGYVVQIQRGGKFTETQYLDHETVHLWVYNALSPEYRETILSKWADMLREGMGEENFQDFYDFIREVYEDGGAFSKLDSEDLIDLEILEETLAICYAGQAYAANQLGFDVSEYQALARRFVEVFNLEEIGTCDMSSAVVAEAVNNGLVDPDYYDRHGFNLSDDTEIGVDMATEAEAEEVVAEAEEVVAEAEAATSLEELQAKRDELAEKLKDLQKRRKEYLDAVKRLGRTESRRAKSTISTLNRLIDETHAELKKVESGIEQSTPATPNTNPAPTANEQTIQTATRVDVLKTLRKNLAKERRRIVANAKKNGTTEDATHRAQVEYLNEQIKAIDDRIGQLGGQFSLDYEEDNYGEKETQSRRTDRPGAQQRVEDSYFAHLRPEYFAAKVSAEERIALNKSLHAQEVKKYVESINASVIPESEILPEVKDAVDTIKALAPETFVSVVSGLNGDTGFFLPSNEPGIDGGIVLSQDKLLAESKKLGVPLRVLAKSVAYHELGHYYLFHSGNTEAKAYLWLRNKLRNNPDLLKRLNDAVASYDGIKKNFKLSIEEFICDMFGDMARTKEAGDVLGDLFDYVDRFFRERTDFDPERLGKNGMFSLDYEEADNESETLQTSDGRASEGVGEGAQDQGVPGKGTKGPPARQAKRNADRRSAAQKAVDDINTRATNMFLQAQGIGRIVTDNGGYVVEDADVPEEFKPIYDHIQALAPGMPVVWYVGPADTSGAFISPEKRDGIHHGGILLNLAAMQSPKYKDQDLKHVTPRHELGHFYLYTAPGYDGDLDAVIKDLTHYIAQRLNTESADLALDAIQLLFDRAEDLAYLYEDDTDSEVYEEAIVGLLAGDRTGFEDSEEARRLLQSIISDWFVANTDYDRVRDLNYGARYSLDYDEDFYQSVGLITPEGETAAFTDNIGGVHEEILNQLNGTEGEDIKDFIRRGGIRVKPGVGIEVNGDIAPTMDQYDVIDQIVASFPGESFTIDFNIDGTTAFSHTFEGTDIDPSRVYTFLRNYYARRKLDIARDQMLLDYEKILGVPVKTMEEAYKIAKFLIVEDEGNADLQGIIDTYEKQRFSLDYLDPESDDYLGPEIDEGTLESAREDMAYRQQGGWIVSEEELAESQEDAKEAQIDALTAELMTLLEDDNADPKKVEALTKRIVALQQSSFVTTKAADEQTGKKKKSPVQMAFKKKSKGESYTDYQNRLIEQRDLIYDRIAELEDLQHTGNEKLTVDESIELDTLRKQAKEVEAKIGEIKDKVAKEQGTDKKSSTKKKKNPAETAFKAKAEPKKEAPAEEKPAPEQPKKEAPAPVIPKQDVAARISEDDPVAEERAALLQAADDVRANPELAADEEFQKYVQELTEKIDSTLAKAEQHMDELEAKVEEAEQAEETEKAPKPTALKDDTKYTRKDKKDSWWKKIAAADSFEIRRRRSDRNTFDVRFKDDKGNTVVYDEVSPAMLIKIFGVKTSDRKDAMKRMEAATASVATPSLEWQPVSNEKIERPTNVKPKQARSKDNLGRDVPAKLSKFMERSVVRTPDGALINTYRLAPANGVHNAKIPGRFSMFSTRPAAMNTHRGMSGAEAYGQSEKAAGERLASLFERLADPKTKPSEIESIRRQIAQMEKENARFFSGITRLDPYRPGFQFATRENVVGGKTLLETYLDIRKPKVIDAKGKGLDFVQRETQKYVSDPANKVGLVDANKDPVGPHDGLVFTNVNVVPEGKTLGGGELDLDTIYVTFRNNQAKSTYNTDPSDSDLIQYSLDYEDVDTGYTDGSIEDTILKILTDKDEDHAAAALAEFFARFMQTGVVPLIEDEKTRNIFQPRVTPEQAKTIDAAITKFIDKYGALEKGEKPARDVSFPKKTDTGYTRRAYRTAAESKNTPDFGLDALKREFLLDAGTYQRVSDKSAMAFADREMSRKGFDKVLAEWQAKLDGNERPTKNDVAIGEMLFNESIKAGDLETAMRTLAELAEVGTTAGQAVQAFRMLKKMPKSYQLYYFQRVASRLNRQYSKQINSGKMSQITVDRELAKAVMDAKTREDLDAAIDALIQNIADQIPSTMWDKWNAWRYLSMLGNPKTHIRNLLGNAIFTPAKFAKDLVNAGLQTVLIKDPNERTSSLKGMLDRKARKPYLEFAREDYEGIKKELQSGGKYNPANEVMDKKRVFKLPILEWLRRKNGDLLEDEDGIFLKFHYVNALTNFLTTKGLSLKELQSTREGAAILNAARQYAFLEAQKATYRDASAVATALNQLKRVPGIGILMEGLLPFAKTPINILKRGIEYSPIGLIRATTTELAKLKNGDIDANQFTNELAAGLTGTGIAILGFWLASQGILRGGDDDDDKQADADKLVGLQNYSINIGDTNYTIDWMAPSALPLFVGAAVFDELKEKNGLSGADIYNALTVIAEPITQLSMLSGLNDTLKSAKWDDNPFASVVQSMASGYVSQGLPTALGQLARSFTEDRRTTYVDKNSDIPQPIQRWFQTNVMGKIPGLNNGRATYIDAWGRKDTTQSFLVRVFDNMISPGYRNEINITSVDKELQRLADKTGTSVLMSPADRYIEFNNQKHNLTAEQYEVYARVRGNGTFAMLTELFNSDAYARLSDAEKAKAVQVIKEYGTVLGKQAVFPEYDPNTDNWAEKCDGDPTRLINMTLLKAEAGTRGITVGNNYNFYAMVISSDWMTNTEKAYAIAQQYATTSKTVSTGRGGKKYDLTPERKQVLYKHIRDIFPAYYEELVSSKQWKNASASKRLELLKKVRAIAGEDAKVWLAKQLSKQ